MFIFSEIPELVAEAKYIAYLYLCTMAAFLPFLYSLYVFLSALQGMGYTVSPIISGIIELIIRIVIAGVISWTGYKIGIFGGEIIAWIGATLFLAVHFHKKMKLL